MTVSERLEMIDALRDRGATVVEIDGDRVRAVFGPVPKAPDEIPEGAKKELAERLKQKREGKSLEERLFGPLGIGTKKAAG